MGRRRTQIVTDDEAKLDPCFVAGVVEDDESSTGGNGVGLEIVWSMRLRVSSAMKIVDAMVCGNSGEVSVRVHEVEGEFSLWKEFVSVVYRKGWVCGCEDAKEVPFERLNATFREVN